MTVRAARWILFAALALALPLPFFMAALEVAPLARLLFLAGMMAAVAVTDGLAGTAPIFAAFLAVQGLVYAGALGALARVAGGALGRVGPRSRAAWVAVCAGLLVGSSFLEIYRTPHSSSGPTANLLRILD